MALDIGLHLLGGDPLGYYRQPPEVRTDLLAYWQVMQDREHPWRWASMGPARLGDLALHGMRTGWSEVVSGLRAWLGSHGVRWRSDREVVAAGHAVRQLHVSNARRCGASPAAVAFWLG